MVMKRNHITMNSSSSKEAEEDEKKERILREGRQWLLFLTIKNEEGRKVEKKEV